MLSRAGRLLLLLASVLCAPLAAQQDTLSPGTESPADSTVPQRVGAPVVLGSDTLFHISSRLGSFSAEERAQAVRKRLQRLTRSPDGASQVHLQHAEGSTDVLVEDQVIVTVTEADAEATGVPRQVLARRFAEEIGRALREHGFSNRLRVIELGVLYALITALAVFLLFRLINRSFPRLYAWIESGRGTWIPSVRIQKVELTSADQLANVLLWLARMLRIALLLLLFYIALPLILSFFPWTRDYADQLFNYIVTPFLHAWNSFVAYVPKLFAIAAIVVITWYLLRVIRPIFIGLKRGSITLSGFYPDWAMPTYKIVRSLILVFAFIAIWPYLPGSDSEAFKGVGVLVGLLVSLGSASAISNMVGGVVLTYMRPFRIGDRVKISDTVGDVIEKSLLVTRIRTIKNVDITIPNSMVLGSHITNFSSSAEDHGLILNTTVTIGYDVPWPQVHELLVAAARATPGIVDEPPPFVLQTSLDDFYVSYELNAITDRPNRMAVTYSTLHANIQDQFNEAGVEIMSPHYRAARDGHQSTIPAGYLPGDYRTPSFRVTHVPEEAPNPAPGPAGDSASRDSST